MQLPICQRRLIRKNCSIAVRYPPYSHNAWRNPHPNAIRYDIEAAILCGRVVPLSRPSKSIPGSIGLIVAIQAITQRIVTLRRSQFCLMNSKSFFLHNHIARDQNRS